MQLSRNRGGYRPCLWCLALLVLLLAACRADGARVSQQAGPTPTPLPPEPAVEQPTYVVQRGAVSRELGFTARVAPVQEARLFFRTAGHVNRLHVQRGDAVAAGDVLAELAMADLERQLAGAQLELAQAEIASQRAISRTHLTLQERQLALERAQAVSPQPGVLRAEIQLAAARAALENAQHEYVKSLDRSWESPDERQRYAAGVAQAETALQIAEAEYAAAVAGQSYDLRQLRLSLSQAELEAEAALSGLDPRLALQVAHLEAQVAERQLVAPFDGAVLALAMTPGDRVDAYAPILTVGDPGALELRADLTAQQINELQVGQPVTLITTDVGAQPFEGVLRRLPYGWGGDAEETDRSVRITPGPGAPTLTLDQLVRVTVVLEHKPDALWLPPAAIQTFRGRTFVFVQEAGPSGLGQSAQRRVDVVTGIETDERVEIVAGLEAGQTVVLP
jgi:multidrug efflux pump subunit AcrA (membrane-fusion protein)